MKKYSVASSAFITFEIKANSEKEAQTLAKAKFDAGDFSIENVSLDDGGFDVDDEEDIDDD